MAKWEGRGRNRESWSLWSLHPSHAFSIHSVAPATVWLHGILTPLSLYQYVLSEKEVY